MLTGESVPVLKFALPPVKPGEQGQDLLQIKKNERSILFCGTKVLQVNNQISQTKKNAAAASSSAEPHAGRVRAVVIRTGFMTAKGELTRLILYPRPFDFEFAADAAKFVGVMSGMALVGVLYSIGIRVSRGEQ